MKYVLNNGILSLTVDSKGAEIHSLKNKETNIEYIWNANEVYWPYHAPLLFPVIGDIKNNTYFHKNKKYIMPVHGFIMEEDFKLKFINQDELILVANETDRSLSMYPFRFSLEINYKLEKQTLYVKQTVKNTSAEAMPFSIGEHVGFSIPLFSSEKYSDYRLEFDEFETAPRYPLLENREIGKPEPFLKHDKFIRLNDTMFDRGALNFKDIRSQQVSLISDNHNHGITMTFPGFGYFSIWSIPKAPFICIEPCNGIAADENTSYDLFEKEGIHVLLPGESEQVYFSIITF